jgi:SAM-dependent methyltransferase
MATNLSLAESVSSFYQPIHTAGHVGPTVHEFRDWLTRWRPEAKGQRALDAGCGFHLHNTGLMREAGFDVTSIDINPPPGALYGSVLDMPFGPATFDLVISTGVLHHTPAPAKGLAEIARVMKPSALAYVSLYCFARSPWEWIVRSWRAFGRVVPFRVMHRLFSWSLTVNNFVLDHMYVPTLWLFTRDDVLAMAKATGLELVEDFRSVIDRGPGTGDGLVRVFVFRKP